MGQRVVLPAALPPARRPALRPHGHPGARGASRFLAGKRVCGFWVAWGLRGCLTQNSLAETPGRGERGVQSPWEMRAPQGPQEARAGSSPLLPLGSSCKRNCLASPPGCAEAARVLVSSPQSWGAELTLTLSEGLAPLSGGQAAAAGGLQRDGCSPAHSLGMPLVYVVGAPTRPGPG